ncbi:MULTISPECIES: hypothetical protein [Mycobacterium avium complex (MAC)]|uniref:Uncharacterized protein n=2 Tax=Mycobacterium avium complex (MAC) TaxID=120793 RepID=A0ABX3S6S5_MYCBC|nr:MULTISPECIES: hypothetical protein [Mycobacterium avium complex (MAC)]ORA42014.1 hypothetical protein BST19_26700 [Mycobacterium bouchedurhonense]
MPDWTYHPLRPLATAVLGERRTQVLALRFLAALIRHAGGRRWIPVVFDHPTPLPEWSGRFGASVPPWIAREAITVLPVQGAGVIEINPVRISDVELVRRAAAGRRCRVTAVADSVEVCDAIAGDVDAVSIGNPADTVRLSTPNLAAAIEALADPSTTVLATPPVLVAAGPGWFNRVIEAATPTSPPAPWRDISADPRRWPGWLWAALVGVGLIVAGAGAAAITLGPVLLWYDRDYLGASVSDLHHFNRHLVGFLQHDRITMAGNMIGIGILYLGLAQQMRQGYRWARRALLISGLVAFLSYFYFLGTGFVEPLHTLVVIVLFPMLLLAVWRGPADPHWPPIAEGPEPQRRRALWGQLLMIGVGAGLAVAGAVISMVGLTSVFVPTDLDFLGTHAEHLRAADAHLLPFIAHDRAGFGGALVGAGLAVLLISMWGWRRGQRWVWWCLLLGCAFGTVPVLVVHFAIGYTHLEHLLPVYVLVVATATSLVLSKDYLTARNGYRAGPVTWEMARRPRGTA